MTRKPQICTNAAFVVTVLLVPAPARAADAPAAAATILEAGSLRIGLDATGHVCSMFDLHGRREYLAAGQPAPLLSVDRGNRVDPPVRMTVGRGGKELRLGYADEAIAVTVAVTVRDTHLAFELVHFAGTTPDAVVWGPFPTTIGETIGETVGVVRDGRFAFGIQGLNLKTTAGASAAPFGSTLRAKTKDRTRVRTVSSGDVPRFTVPAMAGPDAPVQGSRIALFGCRADAALDVIGRIELAEGLPHPMLDGTWAKTSPEATRSYFIIPLNPRNLDDVLAAARQSGLRYVYHMSPFRSWGHFDLDPDAFPAGIASLRQCVQRAEAASVRIGVHTLSNFIQPNDPYVTPEPHPGLARVGSSRLAAAVDEKSTMLPIADPTPFRHRQTLSTAVVGRELIRYGAVSEREPWALLDCRRGAFGTRASAHAADADIGKLWDHPYQVFLPGLELQDEMAARIADLFNRAGLRQISFDGLEGCQVTGEGDYAEARFVKTCYDKWRVEVISDSSQLKHFTWHMHTRMNWGEPWGKAMREGMPEYRFKNQEYFRRNLLPPMLGWFQIQPASAELEATTLDDVEWVLAKCAGFDAGCAWVTSVDILKGLGDRNAILAAIREWDRARHRGAFSKEQCARLRGVGAEFHLEAAGEARWQLTPVAFSQRFVHRPALAATRPAAEAPWTFDNRFADQPLRFVLRVAADKADARNGHVADPTFVVEGQAVKFAARLTADQYLISDGDGQAHVCDANWNRMQAVKAEPAVPACRKGSATVLFRCETGGGDTLRVEIRFKTIGSPEPVG